jgi:hypothetical protein
MSSENKREEYERFLKGKRVCLVGPAPTIKNIQYNLFLENHTQVEKIEDYDLIVRLNKSLPMPNSLKEFVGEKTNIIYNCMSPDPESGGYIDINYLEKNIDWLVSSLPEKYPFIRDITNFKARNRGRLSFTTPDLDYFNEVSQEMNTRPNTGVMAILDLLSCDIEELYITGITFFRGGYTREYRNYSEQQVLNRMAAHGNHHQKPQLEYMKKVLKNDNRIKMDKYLKEIIHE